MPEYALLVESEAAVAIEIGANARPLRNHLVQGRDARNLVKNCLRPSRKSVEKAVHGLKEREIGVAYPLAREVFIALGIMGQNALEPAQELGNSRLTKMLCATQSFRLLLLVV